MQNSFISETMWVKVCLIIFPRKTASIEDMFCLTKKGLNSNKEIELNDSVNTTLWVYLINSFWILRWNISLITRGTKVLLSEKIFQINVLFPSFIWQLMLLGTQKFNEAWSCFVIKFTFCLICFLYWYRKDNVYKNCFFMRIFFLCIFYGLV